MPDSESGIRPAWGRPLILGLAVLCAALGLVASRVVWFDPYWVFRQSPPWLAQTQGANRLLDRQMRRAKALQALTRSYDIILLGSSTTYHGLDPRDADPGPLYYNAGISGVLADELPTIASIVASRRAPKRAVIGLDYYMFSRGDRAVQLARSLATPLGRVNALLGSYFGRYAIHDAWLNDIDRKNDPGQWTYEGFRITPKLSPEDTLLNDRTRRRTTVPLQPSTYASLEKMLEILRKLDIDLYLAPVSPAQRRVFADLDIVDDFAHWRSDMEELARRHGVRFHDLTALGSDDSFDPRTGSTDAWLDNLHYTPLIGRQVLRALGLRSRP